jgi:hypothetical protein
VTAELELRINAEQLHSRSSVRHIERVTAYDSFYISADVTECCTVSADLLPSPVPRLYVCNGKAAHDHCLVLYAQIMSPTRCLI